MENKKNDTIKKFLVENKQEIPDNGLVRKWWNTCLPDREIALLSVFLLMPELQ